MLLASSAWAWLTESSLSELLVTSLKPEHIRLVSTTSGSNVTQIDVHERQDGVGDAKVEAHKRIARQVPGSNTKMMALVSKLILVAQREGLLTRFRELACRLLVGTLSAHYAAGNWSIDKLDKKAIKNARKTTLYSEYRASRPITPEKFCILL